MLLCQLKLVVNICVTGGPVGIMCLISIHTGVGILYQIDSTMAMVAPQCLLKSNQFAHLVYLC